MSDKKTEVYEYVQKLTGKDPRGAYKQTSMRLAIGLLARVDALAEVGKTSRNQIINDAIYFGLQSILEQFEEEERNKLYMREIQIESKLSEG